MDQGAATYQRTAEKDFSLCSEAWLKLNSSVTRQNLMSEIKEKEENNKNNLFNGYKYDNAVSPLNSFHNKNHSKPLHFIDNKPISHKDFKNKNKTQMEGIMPHHGVGRGNILRTIERQREVNPFYNPDCCDDWAMLKGTIYAPITCQVEEVHGDACRNTSISESLRQHSQKSRAEEDASTNHTEALNHRLGALSLATPSKASGGGAEAIVGGAERNMGGVERYVGGVDRNMGGAERYVGGTKRTVGSHSAESFVWPSCESLPDQFCFSDFPPLK